MEYILFVNNRPVCFLCSDTEKRNLIEATKNSSEVSSLHDLLRQLVITDDSMDSLLESLNFVMNNDNLRKFRWLADSVKEEIDQALLHDEVVDCLYIREKRLDLEEFISKLADQWQEEHFKAPDDIQSAHCVVSDYFMDIYKYHGFDLDKQSDSCAIADVLHDEILEYWGGICWNAAELGLNDRENMYDETLESMDLRELVEFLHGTCVETS